MNNIIFVVGTGRSGTSTVARILHEHEICCMGHKFRKPDERNVQGYWEDLNFRKSMLYMLADENITPEEIQSRIYNYHQSHGCSATGRYYYGYKHPLLAEVIHDRWITLAPSHIFWAQRPRSMVIDSLRRWGKLNYTSVILNKLGPEEFYDDKMDKLNAAIIGLPNVTIIDFSEPRTDEWVLDQIENALEFNLETL